MQYLQRFPMAGRPPLVDPPSSWINRAAAIPVMRSTARAIRRPTAKLSFDSWVLPEPVGVRGDATLDHRQMRFELDDRGFELRAEKVASGWEFVARFEGTIDGEVHLRHGRTTVWPNNRGIFQWSAKRPPRTLSIYTEGKVIELPKLIWSNRPHKN